jgi:hypothetical protein
MVMINDRNLFFRFSHRELKNSPTIACQHGFRFKSRKGLAERANQPQTPIFGARVSDNGLLGQPELGFQAELDIASIWERVRVFTLAGCKRDRR